jgi:hypothetical protein
VYSLQERLDVEVAIISLIVQSVLKEAYLAARMISNNISWST